MSKSTLAWHFVSAKGNLTNNLREVVAKRGLILTVGSRPKIKLCSWGLHASRFVVDALQYAPSLRLCRVRMSGKMIRGEDKLVATRREVLWIASQRATIQAIRAWTYACADRVARVYAPRIHDMKGYPEMAKRLRVLKPITDRKTALAALQALRYDRLHFALSAIQRALSVLSKDRTPSDVVREAAYYTKVMAQDAKCMEMEQKIQREDLEARCLALQA